MNVHDVAVLPGIRGQGIGQALSAAETHSANAVAASSLEVLTATALRCSYQRFGFVPLRSTHSRPSQFMQKWLD
jgi:predicted N-acetyltransferase YhbS